MSSSQTSDKLLEHLKHLEDEWNAYKTSLAHLSCRRFRVGPPSSSLPTTPTTTTTTSTHIADSNFFDIIHESPKMLVPSLQHLTTTLHPTPSASTSPASSLTAPDEGHAKLLENCSRRSLLDELERAKYDDDREDDKDEDDVLPAGSQCSGGGSFTVGHVSPEDDNSCRTLSTGKNVVQQQIDPTDDADNSYVSSSSEEEEEEVVVVERGGDRLMKKLTKMEDFFVVFAVLLPLLLLVLFPALMSDN